MKYASRKSVEQIARLITEDPDVFNDPQILMEAPNPNRSAVKEAKKTLRRWLNNHLPDEANADYVTSKGGEISLVVSIMKKNKKGEEKLHDPSTSISSTEWPIWLRGGNPKRNIFYQVLEILEKIDLAHIMPRDGNGKIINSIKNKVYKCNGKLKGGEDGEKHRDGECDSKRTGAAEAGAAEADNEMHIISQAQSMKNDFDQRISDLKAIEARIKDAENEDDVERWSLENDNAAAAQQELNKALLQWQTLISSNSKYQDALDSQDLGFKALEQSSATLWT